MGKLKALPRSKAKTAWGLMADVKRAILAEPKRADMSVFVQKITPKEGGPACGTVGCVAGWVAMLARGTNKQRERDAEDDAVTLLGSDMDYHTAGANNYYVFNEGSGDACFTTIPRTLAHARAVVKRIDKFMRVNEKALKARKLPTL